jgi:hypothetical protein
MSAIDLIIARGFGPEIKDLGTAFGDANKQTQVNQQEQINASNLAGAQQNQQFAAQDQAAQVQASQAAQQAAQQQQAHLAQLSQRVEALHRMDPNSPEAQQEVRAIASELSLYDPKAATAFVGANKPAGIAGTDFGNVNPGDYTPDSLARYAQTRNYGDLVRQYAPQAPVVINTPGFGVGLVDRFNPDNRTMLTTPGQERQARADVASSEAGAKTSAEASAKSAAELPQIEANAQDMVSVLDQFGKSDGFNLIFGPASLVPIIPGTRQADSYALWEQIQGKAFLEAYQTLKGGGQITEVEGKKATAAITRLSNRKITPEAARAAITDLKGVINRGVSRARAKAKAQPAAAPTNQAPVTATGPNGQKLILQNGQWTPVQ